MRRVADPPAAAYLDLLKGGKIPVEIIVRGGKEAVEENAKQFDECVKIIKEAGNKVGILAKVQTSGPFVDDWTKAYGAASADLEEVDVSAALSKALAVKDEREMVRAMLLSPPASVANSTSAEIYPKRFARI